MTKAADFETVWTGPAGDVRLSPAARAEYDVLVAGRNADDVRRLRQLQRFFVWWCASERTVLNDQQYAFEGGHPDGFGGSVHIFAFKPWQWRLYGGTLQVGGRRTFVGIDVDPAKKKNKANQDKLKRAAKEIAALDEHPKPGHRSGQNARPDDRRKNSDRARRGPRA